LSVEQQARRSPWREFAFALHQLQQAVEPALSLQTVMEDWNAIVQALCECPRHRQRQVAQYSFTLS
jgi:hypothetical protein